jgi:uncharacterized protein
LTGSANILTAPRICDALSRRINMVIEDRSGNIIAGEVKAAASIGKTDYRELASLRDARDDSFRAGALFYTGAQTVPLGDRLWALPISALWA